MGLVLKGPKELLLVKDLLLKELLLKQLYRGHYPYNDHIRIQFPIRVGSQLSQFQAGPSHASTPQQNGSLPGSDSVSRLEEARESLSTRHPPSHPPVSEATAKKPDAACAKVKLGETRNPKPRPPVPAAPVPPDILSFIPP